LRGADRWGLAAHGYIVEMRGLDCLDLTPLIDVKPERGRHEEAG
jgi:tRNA (Thr-GGU) A37 N-methylase